MRVPRAGLVAVVFLVAACATEPRKAEPSPSLTPAVGATPAPTFAETPPSSAATAAPPSRTARPPRTTATPPANNPGGNASFGDVRIDGCPVFPADNPWNRDVSQDPVDPSSDNYIAAMNSSRTTLHPDFGSDPTYGIPFVVVGGSQPKVPITFTDYGDESDPGPYPIPPDAPVEAGGDRHVLVAQREACILYELFNASKDGPGWRASSGAVFDLRSNKLRPEGWTSADAAGLPILPGLVRYDEVQAGAIKHALRFTAQRTQRGYIHPATHYASSSTDPNLPPMGLRLRLKAGFDVSGYTGHARVMLEALKRYGMLVADNGSTWFITGATDSRWNDDDAGQLKRVPGSAFEVVQSGPIRRG